MSSYTEAQGGRSKGQMFIVGALIIIIVITLIKTSINVGDVLEKKKFLDSGVERLEFANIRGEVPKSAYNSVNQSLNTTNVTNAFISFVESKLAGRNVQLDGVAVSSYYLNMTSSVNIPLNVTVYNFFDVELSRVVLNLSTDFGSPASTANLQPGSAFRNDFTVNSASSQNLTLWVFYETPTERVVQNVTIPSVIGRTKYVGYFDLRMSDERGDVRDRFVETVDVN